MLNTSGKCSNLLDGARQKDGDNAFGGVSYLDIAVLLAQTEQIPCKICKNFGSASCLNMVDDILLKVRDNWRKLAEKNGLRKSSIEYICVLRSQQCKVEN